MRDGVGTASWIEIAWTAGTIIGLLANAWGLGDAIADKSFLRNAGLNGRRAVVARWHVELNAGLLYVQLAFLVAGITAMLTPPAPTNSRQIARSVTELMLLSAEPVLVGLAIQAHRYRGRVLATRRMRGAATQELEPEFDDDDRPPA